jgi:uncharacterized protein YxjI
MRYLMRKELVAIGDDYWVEDEEGRRVFRVDGKVMRLTRTYILEDAAGQPLVTIKKPLIALRDTMEVEHGGQVVARIRKAVFAPLRQHFDVQLSDGSALVVQGDFTDHEYEVRRGDAPVATISKRWFNVRDTYAVDVSPAENVPLMLSITVAVDWMGHLQYEER